ncbi:imidazole glycerol phosphate synthase subunit HisH [Roseomonas frigidaquae]|uniref:Imidazole glycerol phosphate synthase subunit HisH n=1 Tax=Falsiroseomonas frigidaquae TaxID=487318 RepID=A0ABX1EXK9_9PROT|nr:imidazole glycerol phosphate synthase subunit HisH [Falsiroseomonas frigidaquae]NKE44831.1 imidazole glycerol phosphate synthase subunit HisH [Falsiroseomonas frigidaquae]
MKIAIVDPGSGNLASVLRALERVIAESGRQAQAVVTTDAAEVRDADRIVLPGQGAFAACRRGLDALPGMVDALQDAVIESGKPFLGICVGMQLMAERGLEHGTTPGLGWIRGEIAPMDPRGPDGAALPLPQMGWNGLELAQPSHPLLEGLRPGLHAYFVHSYALAGGDPAQLLASTTYGGPVAAIVGRDNMAGTQFHVEKSSLVGLRILANFLRWKPETAA